MRDYWSDTCLVLSDMAISNKEQETYIRMTGCSMYTSLDPQIKDVALVCLQIDVSKMRPRKGFTHNNNPVTEAKSTNIFQGYNQSISLNGQHTCAQT
jgi:hypothetical protein